MKFFYVWLLRKSPSLEPWGPAAHLSACFFDVFGLVVSESEGLDRAG